METRDRNREAREDTFHEDAREAHKNFNTMAVSRYRELTGKEPPSRTQILSMRTVLAYERLENVWESDYKLPSEDVMIASTTETINSKLRRLCRQQLQKAKEDISGPKGECAELQDSIHPSTCSSTRLSETGLLVFQAQSALFSVNKYEMDKDTHRQMTDTLPDDFICIFGIYDSSQNWVGEVLLDQEWAGSNTNVEFILLSKSRGRIRFFPSGGLKANAPEFNIFPYTMKLPSYNVMMIEQKGEIAIRVGVGRINMKAWENASPETKLVILR
jgi:hypothetical protein